MCGISVKNMKRKFCGNLRIPLYDISRIFRIFISNVSIEAEVNVKCILFLCIFVNIPDGTYFCNKMKTNFVIKTRNNDGNKTMKMILSVNDVVLFTWFVCGQSNHCKLQRIVNLVRCET